MVKSVLIGNRLKPVTAAAEVEVKKASINDNCRVLAPGINNRAVPMAINTPNPITSCKATGNWRELADPAPLLNRIRRCLRREILGVGFCDGEDLDILIPGC